jgi:aryl-alcohol dehydrogenase-like predicted oxidoreductase
MKLFMETTNGKVIEAFFNILHQDSSKAFEMAKEKEVGIIVKIPLDSGWLSGKYNAESTFSDIRKRWSKSDIEQRAKLVESVKQILGGEERIIEKSISFCFSFDAVSTVIPGNKSIEQLLKNVASLDYQVTEEEREKLIEFYFNEVEVLKIPW